MNGKQITILLLEGDTSLSLLLSEELKLNGCRVVWAETIGEDCRRLETAAL